MTLREGFQPPIASLGMSNYNIAVLGPIPRDHITTHHGEVIEKYGCAMHPAVGLSKLIGDEGKVTVVSHLRRKDEGPVRMILDRYPNINTNHITSNADQGDIIRLKFVDQNNRLEKQTGFMDPILPRDVEDLLHCDVFVCVPITDYEVPIETIRFIRENSNGVIIFDAHGPTNTVSIDGQRSLRYWLDRDQWLPYIDVLKMNLEESHCSWFEHELQSRSGNSKVFAEDNNGSGRLAAFAKHVLGKGVKSLIVTLDAQGSVVFFKEGDEIRQKTVPAIWVEHVVDTTGCGDSFAGGLGYGLLQDPTNYIQAVKYANALGAQRTQGRTFDVFRSREETDAMIAEHYEN